VRKETLIAAALYHIESEETTLGITTDKPKNNHNHLINKVKYRDHTDKK